MPLPNKSVECLKSVIAAFPVKNQELYKELLSSDALEAAAKHKLINITPTKNWKEIVYNFFGMNKCWNWKRNIGGIFMVHCPEYPTYFIPSYMQAKATGDATELKKGEGPRGLITGGLEGIAVGALVSGEILKPGEMIPYVILGAGLQLFSSKFFPWLGEKVGRYVYKKNMADNARALAQKNEVFKDKEKLIGQVFSSNPAQKISVPNTQYNRPLSGNLKI